MGSVIEVEGLTKTFGGNRAVDDLDFTVGSGTIHGFLGPNGAGKTTTLKILIGLLRLDRGKVRVLEWDVGKDERGARARVGYMPETPKFPTYLTGHELLDFYGRMYNVQDDQRAQAITSAFEMVGLDAKQDDRISSYSKGMQQRLGLAQALLLHPDLVILDEPSMGLDPLGMVEFRGLIRRLRNKDEMTVFLSSHLLHEVQQLCDQVTIINRGRLVASGTIQEISSKLVGTSTLEIEVGTVDEKVVQAVRSLDFVSEVEIKGNRIVVRVNTNFDVRPQISKSIVEAGATILSMQVVGQNLEDAFIKLMQEYKEDVERKNAN